MKLRRLKLQDFRGFHKLDLAIDEEVTVLVGVNGAGKTSVLDAMALALSGLHEGVKTGTTHATEMKVGDIRNEATRGRITLTANLEGADASWDLVLVRPGHTPEEFDSNRSRPPADRTA